MPAYYNTLESISLDLEVARGARVRARVKWVEEGESSTSYFLCLEQKHSVDRNVAALKVGDGSLVMGKDGLCDAFRSIYFNLFSATPCDPVVHADLLSHVSAVLPPDQSDLCEGPLSREECFAALSGMATVGLPAVMAFQWNFILCFRAKNWRSNGRQWRVKTDQGHQELTVKCPMCNYATEFRKVAI